MKKKEKRRRKKIKGTRQIRSGLDHLGKMNTIFRVPWGITLYREQYVGFRHVEKEKKFKLILK